MVNTHQVPGARGIGNGVVKGLHLDQKTILVEWNASCVGSQLDQDLGIRGIGKLAPVHLDRKFLEIVPSFEHVPQAARQLTTMVYWKTETAIMPAAATTSKANLLRSAWRNLKMQYM